MPSKKKKISLSGSVSIPIDLTLEILSRLPAKSVARFRCVSKQWESMLRDPNFKELFLTKSSAKPRLLFAIVEGEDVWRFFSLPQPPSPYQKSSLVVKAEFHTEFMPGLSHHRCLRYFSRDYASGLIHLSNSRSIIYNPNTGRYRILPYLYTNKSYEFLGFDPIDKQYKVLLIDYPFCRHYKRRRILTLGTGEKRMRWRRIESSLRYQVRSQGMCINGVLYYLGDTSGVSGNNDVGLSDYVIVCFDVRSEKFKFIDVESYCKLINYKGKLGVVHWKYDNHESNFSDDEDQPHPDDVIDELHFWVLEDVEKQEWSKNVYTLEDDDEFLLRYEKVTVVGGTAMGEIVFSTREYTSKEPFYVFYFNPERNTLRRVEIQGFGKYFHDPSKNHIVYTFVNHVEDLEVNDSKLLKSSIYAPYVKTESEGEEE